MRREVLRCHRFTGRVLSSDLDRHVHDSRLCLRESGMVSVILSAGTVGPRSDGVAACSSVGRIDRVSMSARRCCPAQMASSLSASPPR